MYICAANLINERETMIYNATRYTVSSALPYANGPLHIGHLAGAILPADIFARFLRAMDKDVL